MAILGRLVRFTLLAFVGVTAVSAVLALQRKRDAPPPPDPDADEIELVAIFDELDFRSEAQAFRGGRVECWFGGGTLDLRGATLHPDGAVLHTQAIFGGGSVIVPSAAAHPITGGSAPGIAPSSVDKDVRRFNGV